MKSVFVGQNSINIEDDYNPIKDKDEYMNVKQLAFFKLQLVSTLNDIENEFKETRNTIKNESIDSSTGDDADMSSNSEDLFKTIRIADRKMKYKQRILETIAKIDSQDYGYCEKTGSEIGVHRLMARPTTKFCVEVQDKMERLERAVEISNYQKSKLDSEFVSDVEVFESSDD